MAAHELVRAMPHVTVEHGPNGRAIYQVGGKSFFRNPRPDMTDPVTGERYDDVIVIGVRSGANKQALVQAVAWLLLCSDQPTAGVGWATSCS
jgi:hypothetical protein